MDPEEFRRLLRQQLATDRGCDADSVSLYLPGSVGSIFKIRLFAYGYTFVAKGVEAPYLRRLRYEKDVYDKFRVVQARHTSVCLGLIDLVLSHYCDGGVYGHFLLLSWAGRPLSQYTDRIGKAFAVEAATAALTGLHRLQVLHHDAKPRNMLYNEISRSLVLADFERAEIRDRQPLGQISPNRKRKRGMFSKQKNDGLARELQSAMESIARCFGNGTKS